jgi:transcriptional repressor NrdR
MKCPYCGTTDSKVIDSRPADDSARIRRRRECLACQKRFTTYEIVETVPLMVVKKDKSREAFDREKLLSGLMRAAYKRPIPYETLDTMVDNIEQKLLSSYEREVTAVAIGELAMQELQAVDEVAYVRFASVYRQFSDINTFMDELKTLLSQHDISITKNDIGMIR